MDEVETQRLMKIQTDAGMMDVYLHVIMNVHMMLNKIKVMYHVCCY